MTLKSNMLSNKIKNVLSFKVGGVSKQINDLLWALIQSKIADVSAGPTYYIDNNLDLQTIAAGSPLWVDDKLWQMGSWTQYLANPTAPATQTTASLPTGTYYLDIKGSGSAVVSAGTATITGAGTATQDNYVKFVVTVAGTVIVTVTGSVLFFQLIDIQPTPFFNTGATTVLSRAGTSYCNMSLGTKNYKLFEALSGKVSGDNLVPNGDFSSGSDYWTLDAGWTVENGLLIGAGNGILTFATNASLSSLVTGDTYEISFEVIENTLNGAGFGFSSADSFHTTAVYYNEVGEHVIRRAADATGANTVRVLLSSSSTSGQIKIKNFSVKKVTEAAASKITFNWHPYYDSVDSSAVMAIFKTNSKTIVVDNKAGNILLRDRTSTTTCALTSWTVGDTMKFELLCGDNHPDYPGINKMQMRVSKDGGETWINSSVVSFDGSMINAGDTKFYHGGGTLPQAVSNVKLYTLKSGDWPT